MGIFIKLRVMPNKITQKQWGAVYEEAAQLIHAYPFLDIFSDNKKYDCEWSYVERAKEHTISYCNNELGFRLIGDIVTMRFAESFELIKNLDYYRNRKCLDKKNDCKDPKDIFETYFTSYQYHSEITDVFDDKTQGYRYHKYVLAIACLFESRLRPFAMVDGDISMGQINDAIKWVNSILEKPIFISQRADNTALLTRLRSICEDEQLILHAFMEATLNELNNDLGCFIRNNFSCNTIAKYYADKTSECTIGTFGFSKIIASYFNLGHDPAVLCDICITDKHQNFEDVTTFIESILKTGITLDFSDERAYKKQLTKATQFQSTLPNDSEPDTVSSLLEKSLMIFSGNSVHQTDVNIHIRDLVNILDEKLGEKFDVKIIINNYFSEKNKQDKNNEENITSFKLTNTVNNSPKEYFDINNLDELIQWKKGDTIRPDLRDFISRVQECINSSTLETEELLQKLIALDSNQKMRMLINCNKFFTLKREFWDYVKAHINELESIRKIFCLFLINAETIHIHRLLVCLLNNILLLEEFVLGTAHTQQKLVFKK